jgi:hypothetical protein
VQSAENPKTRILANFLDVDSSGSATLHNQEDDSRGVQIAGKTGGSSVINCRTSNNQSITFTPVTKSGTTVSKALVELTEQESLRDVNIPACVANFQADGGVKKELGNGVTVWVQTSKSMFYISK